MVDRVLVMRVTVFAALLASCGGVDEAATVTGRLPVGSNLSLGTESTAALSGAETEPARPMTTATSMMSVDEIVSVFEGIVTRRVECARDPWTCDLDRIAISGSPTRERLEHLFESRRAGGIVASGDGAFRYRIDDVDIGTGDHVTGAADLTVCVADNTVLIDENGWVFDDGLFSGRMVFTMRWDDGEWLWFDDRTDTYVYGEDMCGLPA